MPIEKNGSPGESLVGWMGLREAAVYIGLSPAFVRKAVRLKKIPFARAGSKMLRFRRADLDRWLETNGSGGELAYKSEGR